MAAEEPEKHSTALGALIESARIAKGLTPAELAKETGISAAQISRIEGGHRFDPKLSTLTKLSSVLDLSIDRIAQAAGLGRGYAAGVPRGSVEFVVSSDAIRAVAEANRAGATQLATATPAPRPSELALKADVRRELEPIEEELDRLGEVAIRVGVHDDVFAVLINSEELPETLRVQLRAVSGL